MISNELKTFVAHLSVTLLIFGITIVYSRSRLDEVNQRQYLLNIEINDLRNETKYDLKFMSDTIGFFFDVVGTLINQTQDEKISKENIRKTLLSEAILDPIEKVRKRRNTGDKTFQSAQAIGAALANLQRKVYDANERYRYFAQLAFSRQRYRSAGPQGPVGPRGPPGPAGQEGLRGIQGFPGAPGPAGIAGKDGSHGKDGRPGSNGIPGLPGFPGAVGPKGEQGFRGRTGTQGYPGSPGPIGSSGRTGSPGAKGEKGECLVKIEQRPVENHDPSIIRQFFNIDDGDDDEIPQKVVGHFTRWGSSSCPRHWTTVLYTGLVITSQLDIRNTSVGSNVVCMPVSFSKTRQRRSIDPEMAPEGIPQEYPPSEEKPMGPKIIKNQQPIVTEGSFRSTIERKKGTRFSNTKTKQLPNTLERKSAGLKIKIFRNSNISDVVQQLSSRIRNLSSSEVILESGFNSSMALQNFTNWLENNLIYNLSSSINSSFRFENFTRIVDTYLVSNRTHSGSPWHWKNVSQWSNSTGNFINSTQSIRNIMISQLFSSYYKFLLPEKESNDSNNKETRASNHEEIELELDKSYNLTSLLSSSLLSSQINWKPSSAIENSKSDKKSPFLSNPASTTSWKSIYLPEEELPSEPIEVIIDKTKSIQPSSSSSFIATSTEASDGNRARLIGTRKYVPCSVCGTTNRPMVKMIPGTEKCPLYWHREYKGYLMAFHHMRNQSELICVDQQSLGVSPDDDPRLKEIIGKYMSHVTSDCKSLPCPPYESGANLKCAVCSM